MTITTTPPLGDATRIGTLLAALTRWDEPVLAAELACIDGEPRPKPRPRFNKGAGRAYSDRGQVAHERMIGLALAERFERPFDEDVALVCLFFLGNRRVVDGDNLEKLVWDAGQGVAWVNDHRIKAHACVLAVDRERPRTVIGVAPYG